MGATSRAKIDGSSIQVDYFGTGPKPTALAADGAHLYWINSNDSTIGRSSSLGGAVNELFIKGADEATGLALGPIGT